MLIPNQSPRLRALATPRASSALHSRNFQRFSLRHLGVRVVLCAWEFTTLTRRQVISQSRVEAALRYGEPVNDLQLSVTAVRAKAADGRRQMTVQVNVSPTGLAVTGTGADRAITLDVAVFCLDRQYLVGYVWRRVDVRLTEERWPRYLRFGVGFTVHVPLRRSANMVKAVVYDYAADRIGTAVPPIK